MQAKIATEVLDLDDLVFENRNKSYGAYDLRKHSNDRITAGFGLAVILFLGTLWILRPEYRPVIPSTATPDVHGTIHVITDYTIIHSQRSGSSTNNTIRVRTPHVHPPLPDHALPQLTSDPVQAISDPITQPADNPDPGTVNSSQTSDQGTSNGNNGTQGANSDLLSDASDQVFQDFVDIEPQFPGGSKAMEKYLVNNIEYPTFARDMGIQGTIYVTIRIDAKGNIVDAKVIKGIGGGCDQEVLRVVKNMPRWIPGKNNGHGVPVRCTIPVHMVLAM